MGEKRATAALRWLLEHERLWGVLSIGFAGGLQPELVTGDVVLADRILATSALVMSERGVSEAAIVTPNVRLAAHVAMAAQRADLVRHHGLLLSHDTVVSGALDKHALGRYTGALAADMESYYIGLLAEAHRLPFISMRVILDPCQMELDLPLHGVTTLDGGVLPVRAALAVMRQPVLLQSFWQLWCLSRLSQRRLSAWLAHFVAILDTIPDDEEAHTP
jgi:adenosylhomocysteine nucleosidase